jgi:hypothetical protein
MGSTRPSYHVEVTTLREGVESKTTQTATLSQTGVTARFFHAQLDSYLSQAEELPGVPHRPFCSGVDFISNVLSS